MNSVRVLAEDFQTNFLWVMYDSIPEMMVAMVSANKYKGLGVKAMINV